LSCACVGSVSLARLFICQSSVVRLYTSTNLSVCGDQAITGNATMRQDYDVGRTPREESEKKNEKNKPAHESDPPPPPHTLPHTTTKHPHTTNTHANSTHTPPSPPPHHVHTDAHLRECVWGGRHFNHLRDVGKVDIEVPLVPRLVLSVRHVTPWRVGHGPERDEVVGVVLCWIVLALCVGILHAHSDSRCVCVCVCACVAPVNAKSQECS
jgi:hypothetical protein